MKMAGQRSVPMVNVPRRRVGPAQEPVVQQVLHQKQMVLHSTSSLFWACLALLGALAVGGDLYLEIVGKALGGTLNAVWYYGEVVAAVMLLVMACVHTLLYLQPQTKKVAVTDLQKRLLGIPDNGVGFKTVSPAQLQQTIPPRSHAIPMKVTPTPRSALQFTPRSCGRGVTGWLADTSNPSPGNVGGYPTSLPSLPPQDSPLSGSQSISDYATLVAYWQQEGEREERLSRATPDHTPHTSPRYPAEGTLPRHEYRMATRSPHSPAEGIEDTSFSDPHSVAARLGVSRDVLEVWTEKCRMWIAQTVLQPVAKEISAINSKLDAMGYQQYRIGRATLHTLQRLTLTEAQHLPSLALMLPYLEVSNRQDYLYKRLLDLGGDGCLKLFRWNKGVEWNGRPWNIDLPTDSQIVIHALCCYLDANLAPVPLLTEKTFSQQHFAKTPAKPEASQGGVCIYQSSIHPPHFKVVVDKNVIDVPKGYNNLFHAIIVFLQQVKTHNSAMLGSVNVNLSAVNILWIISSQ